MTSARRTLRRATPYPSPGAAGTTGVERFATALVEFAWLAALAVVPLFFNPRTERVFEPDKLAWAVILALAALWGLAVWRAEAWPAGWPPRRPSPLAAAVGLAMLALAVGTVASRVPLVSVWGSFRRGQGLWVVAAYGILFAAVAATAHRPAAVARFVRIVQAVAIPAALYAVLQRFEIDSLQWNIYGTSPAERAFGPLGNPIFLGAYLVMVLPIALAAMMAALEVRRRGAAGATANALGGLATVTLAGAGLLVAESRGPLLGLAAGLGVFVLLWAAVTGRRRWVIGLTGSGVLVLAVLAAARLAGVAGVARGLDALVASRTAQERLLLWGALGRLFAADPLRALIGHGPETMAYVLPPYLPEALIRLTPVQFFDRAHNTLWEWWVSAGLLGASAYCLLYVAAFYVGFRQLGLVNDRRTGAGLMGAMLGGAAFGAAVPVALGQAPFAALAGAIGLLAGAIGFAAIRATRSAPASMGVPQGRSGRRQPPRTGASQASTVPYLTIGLLAGLTAHLVEGGLGLPMATGELLFWASLGVLAAIGRQPADGREGESRDEAVANPWADGLADGLALAAVVFAPIWLPSLAQTRAAWPILLLVPAYWVGADLLGRPGGPVWARPAARSAVLAALGVAMVAWGGRRGGEIVAFGAVLGATVAVGAWHLARTRPAGAAGQPWRWVVYASIGLLAAVGAWWAALRPELADGHIRAGQEAAVADDRAAARAHFERAIELWPEQPVYATYLIDALRDDFADPALADDRRALAFETARRALERAWAQVPDDHYAQRLGVLYRDRGDQAYQAAEAEGGAAEAGIDSAAPWWREAALHFDQALGRHPLSPGTLYEYGRLLERQRQPDAALGAYGAAFRLNTGNYSAAAGAIRAALALGDLDRADGLLVTALNRDKAAMETAMTPGADCCIEPIRIDQAQAMLLARTGDRKQAVESLGAIERTAPGDAVTVALREWLAKQ